MTLTYNFIKFSKSKAQSIWSMGTACRVNTNFQTIEPGRLHFGFVTEVPILVEDKDNPAQTKGKGDVNNNQWRHLVCNGSFRTLVIVSLIQHLIQIKEAQS